MKKKAVVVGRKREQLILENVFKSNKANFLAIFGRRRIGKTYLIRTFYQAKPCLLFNSNGIKGGRIDQQLSEFSKEIGRTFYEGAELKSAETWFDAFEQLLQAVNKKEFKNKKIILFFDEFPWMATHRSKLIEALDFYWNRHFSQDKRIKLIICGSSASWIIKNIINNKGGLHNRLTHTIQLEPLNLHDTQLFLKHNGVKLNYKHIADIYMATGGIPYYLSHVNSGLSAAQVIEELAFSKNSFLIREFDNLFASLFDDSEIYIELVRAISAKKSGMSQEELFKTLSEKISKGGTIVKKLKDLESTGFIVSFTPYKHQKKGIFYKVIDEYTLFYFRWIEPIKSALQLKGVRSGYWQKIQQSSAWHSWAGYAFEAICFKHLSQISKAIKLTPASMPSSWRYNPQKFEKEDGAQIDLLFERDDQSITICEIKYTDKPLIIDKAYAEVLKQKIAIFKKVTRINTQYFLALISANGLKETIYSQDMIDGVATLEDLFQDEN